MDFIPYSLHEKLLPSRLEDFKKLFHTDSLSDTTFIVSKSNSNSNSNSNLNFSLDTEKDKDKDTLFEKHSSLQLIGYLKTFRDIPEGIFKYISYSPEYKLFFLFDISSSIHPKIWVLSLNGTIFKNITLLDGHTYHISHIEQATHSSWIISMNITRENDYLYECIYQSDDDKEHQKGNIQMMPIIQNNHIQGKRIYSIMYFKYDIQREEIFGIAVLVLDGKESRGGSGLGTGTLFRCFKNTITSSWNTIIYPEHTITLGSYENQYHYSNQRLYHFYIPSKRMIEYVFPSLSSSQTKVCSFVYSNQYTEIFFLENGWFAGIPHKPIYQLTLGGERSYTLSLFHTEKDITINISLPVGYFKNTTNINIISLSWGFVIIVYIYKYDTSSYFFDKPTPTKLNYFEYEYPFYVWIGVITWEDLGRFQTIIQTEKEKEKEREGKINIESGSGSRNIEFEIEWNRIQFSLRSVQPRVPLFQFHCQYPDNQHHFGILSITSMESMRFYDLPKRYTPVGTLNKEGYSIIAVLRYKPKPSRFQMYPISCTENLKIQHISQKINHILEDTKKVYSNEHEYDIQEHQLFELLSKYKINELLKNETENKSENESLETQKEGLNTKSLYGTSIIPIPIPEKEYRIMNSNGMSSLKLFPWARRRDTILLWKESVSYYKTRIMYPDIPEDEFRKYYREVSRRRHTGECVTIEQVQKQFNGSLSS
jgi:hypothetical protein